MIRSNRTRRQTLKTRSAATRLAASLNRGRSIATHVIAAGVDKDAVAGVVNGLRSVAKRLHVEPVKVCRTHRTVADGYGRMRRVQHFTAAQVRVLAANYSPRKPEFKAARAFLLAA